MQPLTRHASPSVVWLTGDNTSRVTIRPWVLGQWVVVGLLCLGRGVVVQAM